MPSTSADRMRRLRKRLRSGITSVRLLVDAAGRQELIALGWLGQQASADEVVVRQKAPDGGGYVVGQMLQRAIDDLRRR